METDAFARDLFARDAEQASVVNVASKAYRRVALYEPGEYVATLTYNGTQTTVANWLVKDIDSVRKTKSKQIDTIQKELQSVGSFLMLSVA